MLKKASEPEFSVKGHISFYPYDEAAEDYSETPSLEGLEATLVKYAAADAADFGFLYELKIPGTWPGSVQFKVGENDDVVIANGHTPSGYEYQVMECYYLWSDLDEFVLDPEDSFFDGADATEGMLYVAHGIIPTTIMTQRHIHTANLNSAGVHWTALTLLRLTRTMKTLLHSTLWAAR